MTTSKRLMWRKKRVTTPKRYEEYLQNKITTDPSYKGYTTDKPITADSCLKQGHLVNSVRPTTASY